jgi:hypothetical protein
MATIQFSVRRRIHCIADETVCYEADAEDIAKRMAQGMTQEEALEDILSKGAVILNEYDVEVDEVTAVHERELEVL